MVFDIFTLVEGLWIILPAYAANGFAPLAKYFKTHPIDMGRSIGGKRILGDGKSWEGLAIGVGIAVVISVIHMLAFPFLPWGLSEEVHGVTLNIVQMGPLLGLLLGIGAMMGDIVASFAKRRIGLARGSSVPVLDQDDFLLGAFIFASLIVAIEISWVILYMIITPLFHLLACVIGFKLKIKKVPY